MRRTIDVEERNWRPSFSNNTNKGKYRGSRRYFNRGIRSVTLTTVDTAYFLPRPLPILNFTLFANRWPCHFMLVSLHRKWCPSTNLSVSANAALTDFWPFSFKSFFSSSSANYLSIVQCKDIPEYVYICTEYVCNGKLKSTVLIYYDH